MKNKKEKSTLYFITKTISWCVMAILVIIGLFLVSYIAINKIANSALMACAAGHFYLNFSLPALGKATAPTAPPCPS